ncbi:MAG TPA: hypothetical protein VFL59_12745 [Candidatus Nanopelagicales bacterium]|nr:hypothetical protein [Candidatus Nanopelagicales bacterium]
MRTPETTSAAQARLEDVAPSARRPLPSVVLLAAISLLLSGLAECVSVLSDGAWRLEVVVLALVLRESQAWWVRFGAASVVVATSVGLRHELLPSVATPLVGIALAAAIVLLLWRTLAPSALGVSFARRFAASMAGVLVAGLVAGLVQTSLHGWPTDVASWRSAVVTVMLPLLTAAFVGATLMARHSLLVDSPRSGGRLTGPFAAIAVTVIAIQLVTGYWGRSEQQSLDTAAQTVAASFQQVLADDLTTVQARTSTPPTTPLASRDQAAFTRYAQPLV